ncbi:MAG TPA: hypothetical protein VF092_30870 [Longimicrobium sp.]
MALSAFRSRLPLAALVLALVLGAAGLVPGGDRLASFIGIAPINAQVGEICPNTDCKGSADCEYLQGFECALKRSSCTVTNCSS